MKKVNIWRDQFTGNVKMVFIDFSGGFKSFYNPYTGIVQRIPEGESINSELEKEFVMTLPGTEAEEFLQSLAEALDERNIKTDKDAKIQGTMEATKYHLEDMRKLVFKNNKIL